jgi:hypothetical protein
MEALENRSGSDKVILVLTSGYHGIPGNEEVEN